MTWKLFATVFATIFLAELGDKTQLATLLYAAERQNPPLVVFAAAALALIVATGLGVVAGAFLSAHVPTRMLQWAAGMGFIGVGIWTLAQAARAA